MAPTMVMRATAPVRMMRRMVCFVAAWMGASGSGAGPRRLVGVRRVVLVGLDRLVRRVEARRRVAGRVVVVMVARGRRRVVVRVIILAGRYI